ncbi:L-2-hydroxyglutarate oxidase [Arthrobacter sp. MI7-26]|uniref:L-2-hydroxyglutarate oxidase n=1 Tax=Arthrobacter sp. MI7-26 TaxID=2993653 RepID=UPI0022493B83|nr:L-2-hydroxyglutarate oxidase [Arthrobacter sp. MI7-26]MCX2749957.1 L-2-hydroxyglutarate oxidase [Arthrobacter sp. MI7-26]
MSKVRAAVVGGGIIGIAVARQLTRSLDNVDVTVFEKENGLAGHQTGHNSGVVHAGLYYEPGSLKARLCRRGVDLLRQFTVEKNLGYEECGKVVVAHNAGELDRLKTIHGRAMANGVPDVRMIDADELAIVEPHARGLAALHSPRTAIVDYGAITDALAQDVRAAGGNIVLGLPVTGVEDRGHEVRVQSSRGTEAFDVVITCAGLQSDRLAHAAGDPADPRIVPFFGDYFLLRPEKRSLVKGLIYPVPDPRYPFLGVHLTKRIDGAILVGPNAFLAGGREAYRRTQLSPDDLRSVLGFPGFWRFAARNLPAAAREARTVINTRAFVREAQKYVPDILPGDVTRGPRGIRAQAMTSDGGLVDDFVITGSNRVLHVRNAPSPGATSSMAIAEHIVAEAMGRAKLS